ncbi:MAG TPA: hypothetical protein VIF35_19885 [Streptosporangiaceae bacterium]
MTNQILTPAVMEWAGRAAPGARVARCAVRPLAGGAVARRVDQVTLHLTGHHDPLELVRKQVPAHEIAGLRAAQAVRRQTTAIPELVAWGSDWLITPLASGSPLAWGDPVPANLIDALAALHARYPRRRRAACGDTARDPRMVAGAVPWTIGHQPTRDVEAVLDQIEQALGQL